jgi:hypothetical protein
MSVKVRNNIAITAVIAFSSLLPASALALTVENGIFVDEIERLRDLTFNVGGVNPYVPPTAQQRADFAALATSLYSGNILAADAQAAALDYELVQFTNTTTNKVYYGLREELVANVPTRGWGSFFINLNSSVNVLVETPHVRFDTRSWEIGALAFEQSNALGFLMNGAHRNTNGVGTADVAHLVESIFQEVHMAWNGPAGENMAWSIHGFDDANHAFPAGTDAVLSSGDGSISQAVVNLDQSLTDAGFLSYAYNTLPINDPLNLLVNDGVDGTTFSSLGGTTNVQGMYSRGIGGDFIHVELEQSIRFDAQNRALAGAAIAEAIVASAVPAPGALPLLATGAFVIALRRKLWR